MVDEGAVAGESDSPARVRARGRVVRDLGRRVVEPEPEPNTADSALFVQAAAPSSTLVDRLGRLDGQLYPSPTPAAPASPAPATHPVTRSNVTYIVSRSDKDSTRTADISLNLVLVVGLGLLLVVSAPPFQEAWVDVTNSIQQLHEFGSRTHLHIPVESDEWREYDKTERDLVAWHKALEAQQQKLLEASSLIDVVSDHELQLVRSVLSPASGQPMAATVGDSGLLPAAQEPYLWLTINVAGVILAASVLRLTDNDDQVTAGTGHGKLRMLAALGSLLVTVALLALVAKVVVLNDELASIVASLRAAQLALVGLVANKGEKAAQSLCLHKLELMREQWDAELFGLRLAVPVGHSTHGSGVAVHPYFFLTGLLAMASELLWVFLRVPTRQFKLRHGVLMGTGLGILFFFYFYMAASGPASGAITDDDL